MSGQTAVVIVQAAISDAVKHTDADGIMHTHNKTDTESGLDW